LHRSAERECVEDPHVGRMVNELADPGADLRVRRTVGVALQIRRRHPLFHHEDGLTVGVQGEQLTSRLLVHERHNAGVDVDDLVQATRFRVYPSYHDLCAIGHDVPLSEGDFSLFGVPRCSSLCCLARPDNSAGLLVSYRLVRTAVAARSSAIQRVDVDARAVLKKEIWANITDWLALGRPVLRRARWLRRRVGTRVDRFVMWPSRTRSARRW